MSALVDTAYLRTHHPATLNEVWRLIKTDAPDYAEGFLKDPMLQALIQQFDCAVHLHLDDLPPSATALIPEAAITHLETDNG